MRSTFSILFYIKKSAHKDNGKAPMMARITLNGDIVQFSLKCEVEPDEWNPRAQRTNGKSANAVKLNGFLDNVRAKIINHYREISDREVTVTAEKVKNAFLGFKSNQLSLLQLFDKHIKDLELKVGKDLTRVSFLRYVCVRNRLELLIGNYISSIFYSAPAEMCIWKLSYCHRFLFTYFFISYQTSIHILLLNNTLFPIAIALLCIRTWYFLSN